ncbi:MAG: MogA/MoaB family molybdenum cofactor biosynthesis protein, partial [Candidatus Thermoplasmatota archaeon]|nr:MogA/MoaB family molybdenum cofactor biosynthesis protein [Candidatus Thermoplasmatota archaeon]
KAISETLAAAGHTIVRKDIVKDNQEQIRAALRGLIEDANVQAVIMNGGTGVSLRDVTLESVHDFEEKQLPGFGELFRMLSYEEIGSAAIMSRAAAFVTEGKVVFCLPGSEKAVRLATTKLIAPELGHLVWEARR